MKTPIADGQSIDQFIPNTLRYMFYDNPNPDMKYAIHDGCAPYGFSTNGLVLYLPLWVLKDSVFKSIDAYGHTCTVTGALWTPPSRTFDGNDDIDITNVLTGALSALTTGTIILWFRPDDVTVGATREILTFGDTDANEYFRLEMITSGGKFRGGLAVAGAWKWYVATDAAPFSDATWACIGITHNATAPVLYVNGAAPAQTFGGDTDKTAWFAAGTGLDNGYIGCQSFNGGGKAGYFYGRIGEVWIYNWALSAGEITHNYNCTKWRYS